MKIFRRIVYAILMLALLGGFGAMIFSHPEDSESPPLLFIIAFGGMLGALLWSAIFLKDEPTLTRVALLAGMVWLVMFVFWAMQAQLTK